MTVYEQQKVFLPEENNLRNKKPTAEIEKLLFHLTPFSNNFETKERQTINYMDNEKRKCFLLHKGSVSLYRSVDGMVLNTESAPFIFGMSTQMTDPEYLFIRTHEVSEVSWMPLEVANQVIADNNLWRSLSQMLIYTVTRVYDHCTKISSLSSYDIIRYQLYELMSEPEAIRHSVTIANYVQSRTFVSRSSIMKILAQLKTGGYITTDKGLLLAIHNIPLKY
ncbi:helix-turn-helix domain-containing protein [Scandinavium sp. V105_16]|uniref:Helix-turn-helix domain-containing protein n=1 Tax=Scandinavium lactucae TaxID=3095028 RepID=A0AAJ2S5X7_9ENTR|nr:MULTISPECIES: helix-turn-helix domain-containing protein [unclassified Scandinavium]MDX6018766.1 helix-turn-helix domain-containing protein [Scandinavium sp. V105_16]MDX6030273.1 helix-turn-helix domain-containing protein [Scandinavium sp. V105_12]MDX6039061.1 helix-turn-helix domain-containing protein [Scandinavium sp. V105_6]MDX6050132.1 helix-turn-helix domain-containing protein [Scandinavium sp. V105_1]